MKKVLLLLCTMLATVGAWADGTYTATIVDGTQHPCGTLSDRTNSNKTLTTKDAAGFKGVVITAGVFDQATWWSKRCLAIQTSAAQTAEKVTSWCLTKNSVLFQPKQRGVLT